MGLVAALEWLGRPYRLCRVDMLGEMREPSYGRINPRHETPVLITDAGEPLQLVQAMTAITNDGKMMRPQIIDKIVADNGKVIEDVEHEEVGNPISAESAKEVREILRTVVTSDVGTGRKCFAFTFWIG